MTRFILISGKKQSGKDYFATQLRTRLEAAGLTVDKAAFAAPIKRFVNDVFGIPMEDMETEVGKQKSTHLQWKQIERDIGAPFHDYKNVRLRDFITVRELLQIIGTNLARERFYNQIWAEAPFRREYISPKSTGMYCTDYGDQDYVEGFEDKPTDVVLIPDCRFPNEVAAGLAEGAILVRITTPSWGDVAEDNHASETALDSYDWKKSAKFMNNRVGTEHIDTYIDDVILPQLGVTKVGY